MSASVRPTLFKLALPLFIENAMHVLTRTIDVLMGQHHFRRRGRGAGDLAPIRRSRDHGVQFRGNRK